MFKTVLALLVVAGIGFLIAKNVLFGEDEEDKEEAAAKESRNESTVTDPDDPVAQMDDIMKKYQ